MPPTTPSVVVPNPGPNAVSTPTRPRGWWPPWMSPMAGFAFAPAPTSPCPRWSPSTATPSASTLFSTTGRSISIPICWWPWNRRRVRSPFRVWPTEPRAAARRKWGELHLPIQLVPLPTYASWLNPIEKLWRKLKQDVLHLHRLADDLPARKARVLAFLARFSDGSLDLLRYVGLTKSPRDMINLHQSTSTLGAWLRHAGGLSRSRSDRPSVDVDCWRLKNSAGNLRPT